MKDTSVLSFISDIIKFYKQSSFMRNNKTFLSVSMMSEMDSI